MSGILGLDRKMFRQMDWIAVLVVGLLVSYGLLAVYSATHNLYEAGDDPYFFVKRQLAWCVLGTAVALVVLRTDYRELLRYSRPLYVGTLVVLAATLFFAPAVGGAERWLVLGPVRIQPAEFAKLAVIVALAHYLSRREEEEGWGVIVSSLAMVVPPLALIVLQPDLGTALVVMGIAFGMLYIAGVRTSHLLIVMGAGLSAAIAGIALSYYGVLPLLKEYQLQRFLVFLDPYRYQHGEGWNVIQSMIAIGSGRFFGKGLFGGSQTQLNFLPARHTDFIFSVIGEEFGFLGAAVLLLLYLVLIWRLVRILGRAKDRFGALIVAGCISMLGLHMLINLGMVVGLMPVTGLPLPFISYGGSSLVVNLMAIGLALNVGIRRQKIRF